MTLIETLKHFDIMILPQNDILHLLVVVVLSEGKNERAVQLKKQFLYHKCMENDLVF